MNDTHKARRFVLDHIDQKTAIVMMMEEASEVVQACSKILRCLSDDPCAATPVTLHAAQNMLRDELIDLLVVSDAARMLPLGIDAGQYVNWLRWERRTLEKMKHETNALPGSNA